MISMLYRGSVKDVSGPTRIAQSNAVIFEFTDSFSVFDWGKMPDSLPRKGEALAIFAAEIFERVEKPETWKEFSRTPEALALRKANRFGGIFNEVGEELQSQGLRTHYLGILEKAPNGSELSMKKLPEIQNPFRRLAVQQVSVVKPTLSSVLGRILSDYYPTRAAAAPRLIPLEIYFRLSSNHSSGLVERATKNSGYLRDLGFPEVKLDEGTNWDFPLLELFTKLESVDRPVALPEALAISGVPAGQLQEILLKTVWLGALIRSWFTKLGLHLSDGKLEWAIREDGKCLLVDAIGPDELRVSKDNIPLSRDFLSNYYLNTRWNQLVEKAKSHARSQGSSEWKRLVTEGPPTLPTAYREIATQLYLSLTNEFTGKKWFPEAWGIPRVAQGIQDFRNQVG